MAGVASQNAASLLISGIDDEGITNDVQRTLVRRRLDRTVEHPLHAKLIGQLAKVVAPGLDAERRRDGAALGQALEKLVGLFAVFHHENMGGAAHGLGVMIV